MSSSSEHLPFFGSSRNDPIYEHFANFKSSKPAKQLTTKSTTYVYTFNDPIYDHFTLSSSYTTSSATPSRSSKSPPALPSPIIPPLSITTPSFPTKDATIEDVRAWVLHIFTSRDILIDEQVVERFAWDGAGLWRLDVSDDSAVAYLLRSFGFSAIEALLVCREIEKGRKEVRYKKSIFGKINERFLDGAAFVVAMVIVTLGLNFSLESEDDD